jgi:hypothetical protein
LKRNWQNCLNRLMKKIQNKMNDFAFRVYAVMK